jgi:sugar fermentation stimulation protein A
VRFDPPLIEGRLVRRYKRFLADIELPGGVVVAHCPNPGSMQTCAPEGAQVWVSESDSPKRKLKHTWELVRAGDAMICVHTGRANAIVAEAIEADRIDELAGYPTRRREVRYGEASRIDLLLERPGERCYVEVKNVTLTLGDRVSAFPDSVTARGTRHLRELEAMVRAGHRAVMLFCCSRDDTALVRPADAIDPTYGRALREAVRTGVEVIAYRCDVTPEQVQIAGRVPVELPPL